jgi:hypothetical protein
MENEKDYSQMNAAELRAAIAEYERGAAAAQRSAPLPPGITAAMTPKSQDTAATLYAESILSKPAGAWTQAERDFIRGSISAALPGLGY